MSFTEIKVIATQLRRATKHGDLTVDIRYWGKGHRGRLTKTTADNVLLYPPECPVARVPRCLSQKLALSDQIGPSRLRTSSY